MKLRIPHFSRKTWVLLDIIVVATILIVVGFFMFKTEKVSLSYSKIPQHISSGLLFTPYVATKLPDGYEIDADSFKTQENALFFAANSKAGGGQIVFSEQSVPKDLNMDEFHSSSIAEPERLDGLKYRTIFGKLQKRENTLASVITEDNTWILITMPSDGTTETARVIAQGLVRQ